MPSLKDIRLRIKSVQTTQQTTKAMKMVAASKLRKAQDNITQLRPYALRLNKILGNLAGSITESVNSPYLQAREPKNVLIVVITSNRGLCGAFNTGIIKQAHTYIEEKYANLHKSGNVSVLTIGRKSFEYFSKRKFKLVGQNHDVFSGLSFEKVTDVSGMVMKGFVEGEWDKVEIFYNAFKNVATQIRTQELFLPVSFQQSDKTSNSITTDYIFEPNKHQIIEELIPKILKMQFYRAVLESNASEHGARMVAMDKATENANELLRELKLTFNKARQAAITKEILEIVGGAEALSGG